MSGVFLSYRRADTADMCDRLYEWLERQLPKKKLFKDIDAIPLGKNFREYIENSISQASIVFVLIGEKWLEIRGSNGQRRLNDPNDFVRLEIESAFKHLMFRLITTWPTSPEKPE